MQLKKIITLSLLPIWLVAALYVVELAFGLISEPNSLHVFYGVLIICVLIAVTLLVANKLDFTNNE